MKLSLSLNTKVTPIWNLNGLGDPTEQIYLSDCRPGPIELETDTLTERELYCLMMAFGKRQLISPEAPAFMAEMLARRPSGQLKAEDLLKRVATRDESIELPDGSLYEQSDELLSHSVNTLKKEITQIDNLRLLRIMREQEGSNKSRKSVMDALEQKVQSFEQDFERRRLAVEESSSKTSAVEVEVGDRVAVPLHTFRLELGQEEEANAG